MQDIFLSSIEILIYPLYKKFLFVSIINVVARPHLKFNKTLYSSVAQWRSIRLLIEGLLVRVQPGEFFITRSKIYKI